MGDMNRVKQNVADFLQSLGVRAVLESSGAFSVGHGSARCFINVWSPRPEDPSVPSIIQLNIPLLADIDESPEANQYVAFHADDYIFGHLSLGRDDFGKVNMYMTHHLLGDETTEEEFGRVLMSMLGTADNLDDQLQGEFGGTVFHD